MMALFRLLAGVALLTLGRKLFWLFVAAIGFEAGVFAAARVLPHQPDWLVLLVALAVGLLGALLALFLQNVVVGAAGFLAGGYLLVALLGVFGWDFGLLALLAFVGGGIVGAALVAVLFDWALIGLSSLVGAITITSVVLPRGALLEMAAIVILGGVGAAIQVAIWQSEKRRGG